MLPERDRVRQTESQPATDKADISKSRIPYIVTIIISRLIPNIILHCQQHNIPFIQSQKLEWNCLYNTIVEQNLYRKFGLEIFYRGEQHI